MSLLIYAQGVAPILPLRPSKDPIARAFGWQDLTRSTESAAAATSKRTHHRHLARRRPVSGGVGARLPRDVASADFRDESVGASESVRSLAALPGPRQARRQSRPRPRRVRRHAVARSRCSLRISPRPQRGDLVTLTPRRRRNRQTPTVGAWKVGKEAGPQPLALGPDSIRCLARTPSSNLRSCRCSASDRLPTAMSSASFIATSS